MKLEIDIDEKAFGIDIADHFQDFFKRLQAEIKSRLISNDTLVCGNYELETVEMLLKAFENSTIVQEQRWIPVSERLPEDMTYVLTTIQINSKRVRVRSGNYYHGFFNNDNGDVWKATDEEVTAWMPLPEPYKADNKTEQGLAYADQDTIMSAT